MLNVQVLITSFRGTPVTFLRNAGKAEGSAPVHWDNYRGAAFRSGHKDQNPEDGMAGVKVLNFLAAGPYWVR